MCRNIPEHPEHPHLPHSQLTTVPTAATRIIRGGFASNTDYHRFLWIPIQPPSFPTFVAQVDRVFRTVLHPTELTERPRRQRTRARIVDPSFSGKTGICAVRPRLGGGHGGGGLGSAPGRRPWSDDRCECLWSKGVSL